VFSTAKSEPIRALVESLQEKKKDAKKVIINAIFKNFISNIVYRYLNIICKCKVY
jgi:hypothetical protein